MCACSCDLIAAVLVAVNQNVAQVIVQTELKQTVAGACDRPAVFGVVLYIQPVFFGTISETSVVVGVAPAAILYAHLMVVVVNHLMEEGCGNFLNRAGQSSSPNVNLMAYSVLGNPSIVTKREMSVGFRGGLDCNGRS